MNLQAKELFFDKMNAFYKKKTPFFFLTDFLCQKTAIYPLEDLVKEHIYFATPEMTNLTEKKKTGKPLHWKKSPVAKEVYAHQFENVQQQIKAGNSYLLNLTCATPIETNYSLKELFINGVAKYKLYYKGEFINFSPEPFVYIRDNKIFSYPMKGTIDAALQDAEQNILQNEKELSEQFTIVDLIRNDLSIVAGNVRVDDFRYVEKITTNQKSLLTISSKISGELRANFSDKPGDVFEALLPAGSICGAPKAKTVEIILATEAYERGFYTGIWGIFDGRKIDSCVIIRYLEKTKNGMVFKSGGGITAMSNMETEYKEMIDKIYVPVY